MSAAVHHNHLADRIAGDRFVEEACEAVEPDVVNVLAKGNETDGCGSTEEYSIGRRRDEAQDVGSVAAKPPESIAQGPEVTAATCSYRLPTMLLSLE